LRLRFDNRLIEAQHARPEIKQQARVNEAATMNWNSTYITTKQAHALCLGGVARVPAWTGASMEQFVMDKTIVDHHCGGSDG
jgi:hypothetical protein